jgi:hypothetical protein
MSEINPFSDLKLKVMPHPDRKPGPVTTYKLTPEELAKYRPVNKNIKEVNDMRLDRLNISVEELKAICKEHGIGPEAHEVIARKFGISRLDAQKIIRRFKIGQEDKAECVPAAEPQVKEAPSEVISGTTEKKPIANINDEIKSRVAAGEAIEAIVNDMIAAGKDKRVVARYASGFGYVAKYPKHAKPRNESKSSAETKQDAKTQPAAANLLKPKTLLGAEMEYTLFDDHLLIHDMGKSDPGWPIEIEIPWEDLPRYIQELQEIERIVKSHV